MSAPSGIVALDGRQAFEFGHGCCIEGRDTGHRHIQQLDGFLLTRQANALQICNDPCENRCFARIWPVVCSDTEHIEMCPPLDLSL